MECTKKQSFIMKRHTQRKVVSRVILLLMTLKSFSSRELSMYGISPRTKNSTKCYAELKLKRKTSFHSDFELIRRVSLNERNN